MRYRYFFLNFSICLLWSIFSLQTVFAEEIIIITEEFPPYNYQNPETGKIEGISTELVRALLKELNLKIEIKIYPWSRAYKMAQEQKNVLIYSMKRTKKRENQFKWVAELVKHETRFLSLKDSPIPATTNLEELKKYNIGAIRSGAIARGLTADKFPNIDMIADREGNWKKLKAGRIDLWCTDLLSALHIIKSLGKNPDQLKVIHLYQSLSQTSLYAAFSKQTDDAIAHKFRTAFKRVTEKEIADKIMKNYGVIMSNKK